MRKGELLSNFLMLLGIPLMFAGMIASNVYRIAPTTTKYCMILFALVGFCLFLTAKISVLRKGQLASFGIKSMNHRNKVFYVCGYVLMIAAFVLMLGIGWGQL